MTVGIGLPPPPSNQPLQNADGSTNSVWGTWFNLVTTTLSASALTPFGVVIAGNPVGSPFFSTSTGTTNQVLVSQGSSAPIYKTLSKLPGAIGAAASVNIGVGTATLVKGFNISSVSYGSSGLAQVNFNSTIANPIAVTSLDSGPTTSLFSGLDDNTSATSCFVLILNSSGNGHVGVVNILVMGPTGTT